MSRAAQDEVIEKFRGGELQGLCTVTKINRGFDLPSISLVTIGFATASRSKFEQMCGRAQRVYPGKTAAWLLDYGRHGECFGSANWDFEAAIEFDRRERLRRPAEELLDSIRTGHPDPKCETRPDNFLDLIEETVDLFGLDVKPARNGLGVNIIYGHALGYTKQYVHADRHWTAAFLRCLGTPRFQSWACPPADVDALIADIDAADLASHIILRRVYDSYRNKIIIAPVGFCRGGKEYIFDNTPPVTEAWLKDRAHSRTAYDHE